MKLFRWRFGPDWASGTFSNTLLDYTQYASPYGHPALISSNGVSGSSVYTGAQVAGGSLGTLTYGGSGSNWHVDGYVYYTKQSSGSFGSPGENVSFTTTLGVRQVIVQLAGFVGSGMGVVSAGLNAVSGQVHNGALVRVWLDATVSGLSVTAGSGKLLQTVDTYNALPTLAPVALDGNPHKITIQHTGLFGGGSSAQSESSIGIYKVTTTSSATVGTGSYTSSIISSGNTATVWQFAEWLQSSQLANFTLMVGNTPTPDPTWTTYSLTPNDALDQFGNRIGYGYAGLMGAGRGQYAQWSMTFPNSSTTAPWVQDVGLYCWIPEQDYSFFSQVALGQNLSGNLAVPGPNMTAIAGTLASISVDGDADTSDFVSSYSVNGAVDGFLYNYATDFGVLPMVGEPQQSVATRITFPLENRSQAGSLQFFALGLASLLFGTPGTLNLSPNLATCSGVVVQATSANAITITIPHSPWSALPANSSSHLATAQAVILRFVSDNTPVGTTITVSPNPPT